MGLWKYIEKYKVSASIGFLFKILEAILELYVPLVMADIIDKGVKNQDINYVLYRGIVLVGLGILGYIFALVCQYYASKTSQSVGTAIRKDIYHNIVNFDYKALDTYSTPTLVTRISNDIIQLQLAIAMTIRLTSRAPFLIIGSLFMAFTVSSRLSIIFLIGAAILGVIMIGVTVLSVPYFQTMQRKLDTISRITRENLQGVRVIRAFSRQKTEKNRFYQETKEQQDIQVKVGKIQALTNPLTYLTVNIAIIIIVYQGGWQIQIGSLSQGEIIALVNYMNQILLALIVLTNVLIIYNKASASYKRVMEVLETIPTITDTENVMKWNANEKALEVKDVYFSYEGKNVLHNINVSLLEGETLGIIGGTGSGKSTLIQLLGRFYEIKEGQILVNGQDIKKVSMKSLREYLGYVPQKTALLSGTVRDNLTLGNKKIDDANIYKALEIAQAKEFVENMPEGLDTQIVQGGKNVSGGQRQRLTIARALVKQPKILILDNSDSALDTVTSAALKRALQQVQGMSTIIISQRTYALQHADKILVLFHGEVVGYDTHEQLLKHCDIYQEIYYSQQEKEEV